MNQTRATWPDETLSYYKPKAKKRSKYFWPAIALIIGLIVGAVIFVASMASGTTTLKDSGVTACQNLADNTTKPATEKKSVTSKDFESSGYTDLKVAGVDFVATLKSNTDDADLVGALGTVSKLHTQYAILQTACANHGVNLPPLPA